jgi:hypothetical protein
MQQCHQMLCPNACAMIGALCAVTPECGQASTCGVCVNDANCAWCASSSACMPVSSIYEANCRGTVFEAPCPETFAAGELHDGSPNCLIDVP